MGRDVRVLPELQVSLDALAREDLADPTGTRLGVGNPTAVRRWLEQIGHVRPAVERLLTAFGHAEALGAAERLRVRVTQLPPEAEDRWVGLEPPPGKRVRAGRLSLVAHVPATGVPAHACGLVIDDWTETVPDPTHLTGVAFHYDQPGAAPPQVILVAVPPDVSADRPVTAWDLDTLTDTILETMDLARLRAAAPDRGAWSFGATIPAVLFDPAELPEP
jgi:hypothetical protein